MEDKNTTNPDFLQLLSHQLKSPIYAIQTLLSTIMEGYAGEVDEKILQCIARALVRTKEAKDVISDLLDYEFFSETTEKTKEEYELISLLKKIIDMYSPQASEKNIFLKYSFPQNAQICLQGYSTAMNQALKNLIENAIKYTPAQGNVSVSLIHNDKENSCVIQVSDTGYGIPAEDLENIFEPFFRSIKTKSTVPGTGLGLAIVKKVVNDHKGEIEVISEENKGSTFTITIPLVRFMESPEAIDKRTRIVIIGGVTAGPKAAARLRRLNENLDITIIEQDEFLSYSGCGLPSFISGEVRSPRDLMYSSDNSIRDITFFETIQNISIKNRTQVIEIDRIYKYIKVRDLQSNIESKIPYDFLVLATGAKAVIPDISGINLKGIHTLRSLKDAKDIKQEFSGRNAKDVVIIGGGLIGISAAESFIKTGARITVLEKRPYILLSLLDKDIAGQIQQVLAAKGIKTITNVQINDIREAHGNLIIESDKEEYSADLIIISAGVYPNTDLARHAGLKIGVSGGILVDEYLKTSDEYIYAVGDCAETTNLITGKHDYWPLGSISTKMGRIVADNICGREEKYVGSIGTTFLKLFDVSVGRTGLTSRSAFKNGFNPESIVITGKNKAVQAQDWQYLTLKVIADKKSKRILGAQAYGMGNVLCKIDFIALAISNELTLSDFFNQDLGYAPFYNRPIDMSQTACIALKNKIEGLLKTMTLEDYENKKDELIIVDVSPREEYDADSIPKSINIPLESLRSGRFPFDKNASILLYSRTSSGAYAASRYLETRGFLNIFVLEGGYLYWKNEVIGGI
ncbi:MAG: GHKL domain-containing protein [Spirochaetales bacterium]|nr:MAG: GHKL domain-containing protein [Spirochaetales bacterium]